MFEEDTLTDRPMRFIAAELVREKIFRLVGDELPYGCTVVIEQWEENDKGARIAACVVVERDSHKPILLGAGGMHMKRIATEARQDIAKLLDKTVPPRGLHQGAQGLVRSRRRAARSGL